MSETTLPPNVDVYRVVKPAMIHAPTGAMYPTWEAFRPTDVDKRHNPVRVSVWDSRKTTAKQSAELRVQAAAADAARQGAGRLHVFALDTSRITGIGVKFNNQKLRAVSDPDGIAESIASLPGADGHSGIEGLDKAPGAPKHEWKNMLDELATCCKLTLTHEHE
jgi:hypothetical protein